MNDPLLVVAVIGYVLAAICLIISIYMYIKMQIPQVIKRLRTIPSKQKIAVKEQEKGTHKEAFHYTENAEALGLFDFKEPDHSVKKNGAAQQENANTSPNGLQGGNMQTSVLTGGRGRAGTVVLSNGVKAGTSVLQPSGGAHKDFVILKSIVLIHTEETI